MVVKRILAALRWLVAGYGGPLEFDIPRAGFIGRMSPEEFERELERLFRKPPC